MHADVEGGDRDAGGGAFGQVGAQRGGVGRQWAELSDGTTAGPQTIPVGARDAAIIMLGYASAMWGSELVALTLLDVAEKPDGLLVTGRLPRATATIWPCPSWSVLDRRTETDPVAALAAWRSLRAHEPGPLFSRFYRSRISLRPLSGDAIARMLRTRADDAGLDATRVTAHSLRAGHATTAALGGVPLARIAAQTRHKDLSVLVNRYIRPRGPAHHLQPRPRTVRHAWPSGSHESPARSNSCWSRGRRRCVSRSSAIYVSTSTE